jgi:hypothetical protein
MANGKPEPPNTHANPVCFQVDEYSIVTPAGILKFNDLVFADIKPFGFGVETFHTAATV